MKREPNANDRVEWIDQATGNTAAKAVIIKYKHLSQGSRPE